MARDHRCRILHGCRPWHRRPHYCRPRTLRHGSRDARNSRRRLGWFSGRSWRELAGAAVDTLASCVGASLSYDHQVQRNPAKLTNVSSRSTHSALLSKAEEFSCVGSSSSSARTRPVAPGNCGQKSWELPRKLYTCRCPVHGNATQLYCALWNRLNCNLWVEFKWRLTYRRWFRASFLNSSVPFGPGPQTGAVPFVANESCCRELKAGKTATLFF